MKKQVLEVNNASFKDEVTDYKGYWGRRMVGS